MVSRVEVGNVRGHRLLEQSGAAFPKLYPIEISEFLPFRVG